MNAPVCPLCNEDVSPLESYTIIKDQGGECFDAHIRCTTRSPELKELTEGFDNPNYGNPYA